MAITIGTLLTPQSSFGISGNNHKKLRVNYRVAVLPLPLTSWVDLRKLCSFPRPQLPMMMTSHQVP